MAGKLGKKRIRWEIKNKALYDAIIQKYNNRICDFARLVNVSTRTVQRWIYDGAIPRDKRNIELVLGKEVF